MDDGTPVIDLIDGPFYDYIVDHPLFHYNCLMTRAKNFHAIVLDEGQADYVKEYHPQVKSVHMLPLGATIALFDGEKNRADHRNADCGAGTSNGRSICGMFKRR